MLELFFRRPLADSEINKFNKKSQNSEIRYFFSFGAASNENQRAWPSAHTGAKGMKGRTKEGERRASFLEQCKCSEKCCRRIAGQFGEECTCSFGGASSAQENCRSIVKHLEILYMHTRAPFSDAKLHVDVFHMRNVVAEALTWPSMNCQCMKEFAP